MLRKLLKFLPAILFAVPLSAGAEPLYQSCSWTASGVVVAF